MYRNVYFQGIKRPEKQQQNNDYVQNPIVKQEHKQFREISPAVNAALCAYAAPIIRKPYEKMDLDECLMTLRRQGKIAGRDFVLEENGDRPWLNIKNEYGNLIFRGEYNGDNQKLLGCEISTYKGNKQLRQISKDCEGRISMFEDYYYNNEIPQTSFTKEGFTYYTTPQNYMEYLNINNINYKVEYSGEEDNNRSITINEYNNEDKRTQGTWFYYGEKQFNEQPDFVSRSIYNPNEQEEKRITFDKDRTEVCTYLEKCSGKTYNNSEFDVSTLTDSHITYNTTPEEYLNYINSNPFYPYKINTKQNGNDTLIEELDTSGNIINSTAWVYENGEFERICRHDKPDENNRRRLDFYKDTTEVMNISYD